MNNRIHDKAPKNGRKSSFKRILAVIAMLALLMNVSLPLLATGALAGSPSLSDVFW